MNRLVRNKGFRQRLSKDASVTNQYGEFIPFGTDGLLVDMDSSLDLERELKLGGKHLSNIVETVDTYGNTITTITENYATESQMVTANATYYRVVHTITEYIATGATGIVSRLYYVTNDSVGEQSSTELLNTKTITIDEQDASTDIKEVVT